jgi:hypothetical protein
VEWPHLYLPGLIQNTKAIDRAKVSITQSVGEEFFKRHDVIGKIAPISYWGFA